MKIVRADSPFVPHVLLLAATLALCAPGVALSQVGFPPPPPKVSPAAGVIDMQDRAP